MDKKYVARQLAATFNNYQKGFRIPIGITVTTTLTQENMLDDVMDLDEYTDVLKRYGFRWNSSMILYKEQPKMILSVDFEKHLLNIPDKRVREYLCTMNQNISQ